MRRSKSLLVSALAVVWSPYAQAREADLLEFSISRSGAAPNVADQEPQWIPVTAAGVTPSETAERTGLAAEVLQWHFLQFGSGANVQPVEAVSTDLSNLPTRKRVGRRWMKRGRATAIAALPVSLELEPGSKPAGWAPCEPAHYVPTWWLSREVEARRAMYFSAMATIACEYGIPTRLLDAVIAQESGYQHWAVSRAGAMGMMQIMPDTARLLGLALPFDPLPNMRAGARYLRQQLDRFGRVDIALAAYNAGPERRSLQRGNVPAIPETLNYVRTITSNWARLAALGRGDVGIADRAVAALSAIRASGYRNVELIRYDGLNRANPM